MPPVDLIHDGPFPIGSVIVKEKLDASNTTPGVGGMNKLTVGFDKSNGDWEYFYYRKPSEFSTGQI